MAINFRSNTIIKNLRVGPLSGVGNGGGGGGSSEPSYLAVGAYTAGFGATYVYDVSNLSATPTKLTPSGLGNDDQFGWSVAATADHLVASATQDDDQGSNAGAVYVYDATNLSATPTKLAPSGLDAGDYFGNSVAASSNQIVVGTPYDADQGSSAGAVYVYDASNLSATPTKLTPSGIGSGDQFGLSVSATSNHIVAGAYRDDDQGSDAGALYVYNATNLSATPTKLTPADLGDWAGRSVAVSSNHIVVGAINDDDQGFNAGAIYVYDINNLSATPTKLTPTGLGAGDNFGWTVAASSDYIVAAAIYDDDQGSDAGAVYVYDANNLSATPTKLAPSSLSDSYLFGTSLTVQGSKIVVGAHQDGEIGFYGGAAYVYDATNLSATPTKLMANDGAGGHRFGHSVSLG